MTDCTAKTSLTYQVSLPVSLQHSSLPKPSVEEKTVTPVVSRIGTSPQGQAWFFIYCSQQVSDVIVSLQPSIPWGFLVPYPRQGRRSMTTNLKRLGT